MRHRGPEDEKHRSATLLVEAAATSLRGFTLAGMEDDARRDLDRVYRHLLMSAAALALVAHQRKRP